MAERVVGAIHESPEIRRDRRLDVSQKEYGIILFTFPLTFYSLCAIIEYIFNFDMS